MVPSSSKENDSHHEIDSGKNEIDSDKNETDSDKNDEFDDLIRKEVPHVHGLYIHGAVNTLDVVFTIDTGASISILSKDMYDDIPIEVRPKLEGVSIRISTVNGKRLRCHGKGMFTLQLGELELKTQLIVAEVTDDVLLGSDILMGDQDDKADLMLSQGVMVFKGVTINLEQGVSNLKVCKVHLADSYKIPAMTEMIVDVFIESGESGSDTSQLIVEPVPQLAEKYSVVMAPCLVDVASKVTHKVRLMNPFKEDRILYQDMTVGEASPVVDINLLISSEDTDEQSNDSAVRMIKLIDKNTGETEDSPKESNESFEMIENQVPQHLKELFKDAVKGRNKYEMQEIAKMLVEEADAFSKHDLDIGCTHLIEHAIETGDAEPIRQKMRPVPMAFRGEDMDAIQKLIDTGTVRPSQSPWASPLVFVRKKNGKVRCCVDYRRLNSVM